MPSINSILSVGYQALAASQNGINVTSNNIANASTEGYTRQRAVIQANPAVYFPYGALGTGASLVDVQRMRDQYADNTFRRENSAASFSQSRNTLLRRLETVLNEPGDLGVSAKLDSFFNVWSELATNPTDTTVRNLVRQSGQELADTFQGLSTQIDQVRQEGEARLNEYVSRVNQLVEDIRDLNRNIVTVEAGGITATDLRDERDRSIDELTALLDVQVNEREDGSVGVSFQGYSIADRDTFTRIEVRFSAGTVGVGIEGRTGLVPAQGGRIGGTLKVLNDDLGDARQRLDDLAGALVAEVNALHNTGTSPNGATGIDFFDPASLTASSIRLSSDVEGDLQNLAAATADGSGAYRSGANDVALAIAAFRDQPSGALGESFASSYRGLVSGIGVALESSLDVGTVAQTLADNAAGRRDALSGVSTDEELVNLIQYQTAYQAAARIITTADEMLQTILNI